MTSSVEVADHQTEVTPTRTWSRSRRLAVLFVAPLAAGALFWAGAATAAHFATPAESTPLTAVVELATPSSTVSIAGTLQRGNSASAVWSGGEDAVITALPVAVGASVASGAPVVEVNGRPVLLLPGSLPMYRDLRPGMVGPDVQQLTNALVGLGFLATPSTEYTSDVSAAVRALYDNSGYLAPPASPDLEADVQSTKAEVRALESAGSSGGSALELQVERDRAQRALTLAQQARADLARKQQEEGTQAQPDSLAAIRDADESVKSAEEQLALAEAAANGFAQSNDRTSREYEDAKARAAAAEQLADTPLPKNEVLFAPEDANNVASLPLAVGDAADGEIATVGDGSLTVVLEVSALSAVPRVDDTVMVSGPQGQLTREATVRALQPLNEQIVRAEVALPPDTDFRENDEVTVTLSSEDDNAEPVETVPRSAIVAETDGKTYIDVVEDEQTHRVEVIQLGSVSGAISIRAANDDTLAGAQVILHVGDEE